MTTTNGGNADAASQVVEAIQAAQAISADEIALYDRQIRLWGVQAQENIRSAKVLLIRIKAVGNEVAKNLVLAGIGSLTVLDDEVVTENDLCAQFLISEADIGRNRAEAAAPQIQRLNNRVRLSVSTTSFLSISNLPAYLDQFSIVITTDLQFPANNILNQTCRSVGVPFYASASHGMYGYIFADLIQHDFSMERNKSNVATKIGKETATRSTLSATTKRENGAVREIITKRETYSTLEEAIGAPLEKSILQHKRRIRQVTPLLSCMRTLTDSDAGSYMNLVSNLDRFSTVTREMHEKLRLPADTLTPEFLASFHANIGAEIAPVTAFLGGHVAQDVINVLGKQQQPIQNFLLFDGETFAAPIYSLHPVSEEVNGTTNGKTKSAAFRVKGVNGDEGIIDLD